MDMTEESGFSLRDAIAEVAFLAIEANQTRFQADLGKVSKDEMEAFQTEIDRKLALIEKQIKFIKKTREFEAKLQARDTERS